MSKFYYTIFSILIIVLSSCQEQDSPKHNQQLPSRVPSQSTLTYGNNYFQMFSDAHSKGINYVMSQLDKEGYKLFSLSEDSLFIHIRKHIDTFVSDSIGFDSICHINFTMIDTMQIRHSNTFDSIINSASIRLTSKLSYFQKSDSAFYDSLIYRAQKLPLEEQFIIKASIPLAQSSYVFWGKTPYTPNHFFSDEINFLTGNAVIAYSAGDVANKDFEAATRALGATVTIYKNCGAFVNLISLKWYLIAALGIGTGYTIYKSIAAAYEDVEEQALDEIDETKISSDMDCYKYLLDKYKKDSTLFNQKQYDKFEWIVNK